MKHIVIGIQARLGSTRLPGKIFAEIDGKPMLSHVIDSACSAATYINSLKPYESYVHVALLIPAADQKIKDVYGKHVDIVEGDEQDVLSRYVAAAVRYEASYVVRLTSDCLYVPPFVISRHIKQCLKVKADYASNVLERMAPEGWDTEVISLPLLTWLHENARLPQDREHVTTLIRTQIIDGSFPRRFRLAVSCEAMDLSNIKTSIDTEEDLQRARSDYALRAQKILNGKRYGAIIF